MSDKPAREWLCPEHLTSKQEDIQARQIELKRLSDEMKIKAQELHLKNSELWTEIRESISGLGPEHEKAVFNACHLKYHEEDDGGKKIQAFNKGACPLCDAEAQDALKHLASGGASGILVTGGEGSGEPIQPPPAADLSEDIMREKRKGRRGMFGGDSPESN